MENEESKQLLLKLLALADRMEQRDAQVIRQLTEQACILLNASEGMQAGGRKFAQEALDALRNQGREVIATGIGQAMTESNRQLQQLSLIHI